MILEVGKIVVCGCCGEILKQNGIIVRDNSPRALHKIAKAEGWKVNQVKGVHICPKCIEKSKIKKLTKLHYAPQKLTTMFVTNNLKVDIKAFLF